MAHGILRANASPVGGVSPQPIGKVLINDTADSKLTMHCANRNRISTAIWFLSSVVSCFLIWKNATIWVEFLFPEIRVVPLDSSILGELCQEFRNAESEEKKVLIASSIAAIENKMIMTNKLERRSIFDYVKNLGTPDAIASESPCWASWNLSDDKSLDLRSVSMQTQGLVDMAEISSGFE